MSDTEEQSFVAEIDAEAIELSTARDAARVQPSSTSASMHPRAVEQASNQPTPNRRPRINYTRAELMNLLRILERVVPVDSAEWQDVAEEHGTRFPSRDVDSLK